MHFVIAISLIINTLNNIKDLIGTFWSLKVVKERPPRSSTIIPLKLIFPPNPFPQTAISSETPSVHPC